MNLYECKELFKQMHPGKEINFEFDQKCYRVLELIYADGVPNEKHHVENNKVKVTVEGLEPIYISILPHREEYTWDEIKQLLFKNMAI